MHQEVTNGNQEDDGLVEGPCRQEWEEQMLPVDEEGS